MTGERPHYALELVKALIANRRYLVTLTASQGAGALGLDERDVIDCALALDERQFYKSMDATKVAGLRQDVYRPRWAGFDLYMKVQIVGEHPADTAVIISFKRR